MARRHSASATKLVGVGAPLPCKVCEATIHEYAFSTFPMAWTARCVGCGLTTRCEPAPAIAPKRAKARSHEAPPPEGFGWPPLWT
jgi:hypothetical protein